MCGTGGAPDNPLTGDHITPLRQGGRSIAANVEILCRIHNSAKHNRRRDDERDERKFTTNTRGYGV
ncbi:MAG: HNH endonuclease [Chloroflexi bacterium]|nr:HNH endonuclease [Chloroflexota bacterium]